MNRPRRTLLLTALIFAAPILIAVTLYQFPGIVGFTGTKNHGSLIQPARPLETIRLFENGEMLDITALEGRWTYVTFSQDACGTECSERLYKTRQVRHALGKDMERAQRLLILLDEADMPDSKLLEVHKDMRIANAVEFDKWRSYFELENNIVLEYIYLVDPLGNLMMYYSPKIDGPLILKDIQRLVKVSWIKPK
jgi:hypothetical protein